MAELLQILQQQPVFTLICAGAFGAVFGSFLNMAIYRLPRAISMLKVTRSFCPSCNHNLAWYDNLPIASYVVLGGKCHYCKKPIGIRYLLIELLTVAMFLIAAYDCILLNPYTLGFLGLFQLTVLGCGLILLIATDFESFLIPEEASLVPLVVALAAAYFLPASHLLADPWLVASSPAGIASAAAGNSLIDALQGAILSAAACYGLGAIGELYKRVQAMGGGDVLLMAAIGATVGWKLGVLTIILAAFIGIAMFIGQRIWLVLRQQKAEPPRFELPDPNGPTPPWYARLLDRFSARWTGVALLCINLPLLYYAMQIVKDQMSDTTILFGPSMGVGLGAFFILFDLVRASHLKKGTWIQTQVETAADGKQVEVYDENQAYLPFGPALAIAGFFQAIWGPWLLRIIESKLLDVPPTMLTKTLLAPFVK